MDVGTIGLRPVLVDGLGGGEMSESKMREALITAREVLVLEGYAEDNLAVVKIDEALTQPSALREQKIRQALQECVNGLDDVMLELGYDALRPEFSRACESLRKGRETLAQQPAAVVELTDAEIAEIARELGHATECEGYKNNTLWFNGDLTDFARAVIAAHIDKQSGATS